MKKGKREYTNDVIWKGINFLFIIAECRRCTIASHDDDETKAVPFEHFTNLICLRFNCANRYDYFDKIKPQYIPHLKYLHVDLHCSHSDHPFVVPKILFGHQRFDHLVSVDVPFPMYKEDLDLRLVTQLVEPNRTMRKLYLHTLDEAVFIQLLPLLPNLRSLETRLKSSSFAKVIQ